MRIANPCFISWRPFCRGILWWVFYWVDGRCEVDVVGVVALRLARVGARDLRGSVRWWQRR